jgi:hypothetical protein
MTHFEPRYRTRTASAPPSIHQPKKLTIIQHDIHPPLPLRLQTLPHLSKIIPQDILCILRLRLGADRL